MKDQLQFNATRFWRQVRRDLMSQKNFIKYGLVVWIATFFIHLPIQFGLFTNGIESAFPLPIFVFSVLLFVITGIVLASTTFISFRRKETALHYMMIPSSVFEKFLSVWFLTGPVYYLASQIILALITSFLAILPYHEVFWMQTDFHGFFDNQLQIFLVFLYVHSIFFLGASTFNRYAFFKTILIYNLVSIAISIFAVSIVAMNLWWFKQDMVSGLDNKYQMIFNNIMNQSFNISSTDLSPPLTLYFIAFLFPLLLYAAAFFKLKEREV